jgi:hypothetical protein
MAAFEEAIFRVYDRSMEGVNVEDLDDGSISRSTCKTVEAVLLALAATFGLITITLHCAIVGDPGCLPDLLHERMLRDNRSTLLPDDAILQINVDRRFYDNNNNVFSSNGEVFDHNDDDIQMVDRRRRKLRGEKSSDALQKFRQQLRSYDERRETNKLDGMGIWPETDLAFKRRPFVLRVMEFVADAITPAAEQKLPPLSQQTAPAPAQWAEDSSSRRMDEESSDNADGKEQQAQKLKDIAAAKANITDDPYEGFNPKYFEAFDFEYASDIGVLSLSDKIRAKHNFTLVNVTMMGQQCFGNAFTQSLIPFGSVDNVLLNNLMFTLNKKGMLISSRMDYYMWREGDLKPYFNLGTWMGFKMIVAVKIFFSYFLLSSSTALLVRILISSGVALVFPVCALMHYAGMMESPDQHLRLVSHAYPWLGIPMEMIHARRGSSTPFVVAHISRVVLFYTLYEALQFASSQWFYDDNQPGQKELWLFALMMIWEYYSMVYVRTYTSIVLFPKATFAAFAIYHIYLYSNPGGFHYLVLFIIFLLTIWLMLFLVRKYEHDAYQRGVVNADQPRQLYNHLPYPMWVHDLAPDFSLFLPPAHRSTSIYANTVPDAVGDEGVNNTGAGQQRQEDSGDQSDTNDGDTSGAVEMSDTANRRPSILERMGLLSPGSYAELDANSSHHSAAADQEDMRRGEGE